MQRSVSRFADPVFWAGVLTLPSLPIRVGVGAAIEGETEKRMERGKATAPKNMRVELKTLKLLLTLRHNFSIG